MEPIRRKSRRIEKKNRIAITSTTQECRARMNSVICNARFTCADLPDSVRERLRIKSCSKCDLFRSSVSTKRQDSVCQRRYGCRREYNDTSYTNKPIKVRILWSTGRKIYSSKPPVVPTIPPVIESVLANVPSKFKLSNKNREAAFKHHAKRRKNEEYIGYLELMLREKENEQREMETKLRENESELKKNETKLQTVDESNKTLLAENNQKELLFEKTLDDLRNTEDLMVNIEADNKRLLEENSKLMSLNTQRSSQLRYLTGKIKARDEEISSRNVITAINTALKGVKYSKRTNIIFDLVFSGELFGEYGKNAGQHYAQQVIKKKFPAWKLCKAKDTAPQGCLNLQGLGQVRLVEDLEKGEKGLFASKSTIWREGNELLHEVAIPMLVDKATYHQLHRLGDTVETDYEALFRFLLADNGLTDIAAETWVDIGFSMDGGSLTGMTSHIFAGAKSLDLRSRKDGKLIFTEMDENRELVYCNIQSNTNIYFMKIAYVKDGKLPYEMYFSDWFKFIQKLKTEGLPARPEKGWKVVKPVRACVPQDTSSIQKAIGMGGACKACNLFCHACACTSYGPKSMLLRYREGRWRCRKFCLSRKGNFSKRCYHWEVDDKCEIQTKIQKIKIIFLFIELYNVTCDVFNRNEAGNFLVPTLVKMYCRTNKMSIDKHVEEEESVSLATTMEWMPTDANKNNSMTHIDFVIPPNQPGRPPSVVRIQYGAKLKRELILRKMYRELNQDLEHMQIVLKRTILEGVEIKLMRTAIDRWQNVGENRKQIDLEDAIFCSLHLELRVNEAHLGGLFNEGFTHRQTGRMVDEYVEAIEVVVNEGKLGLSTHQNQWRFPISKASTQDFH